MNVNFTEDAHQGSWEMVATRDIKPGEELFLPYGPAHWLNILMYKYVRSWAKHGPWDAMLTHSYPARDCKTGVQGAEPLHPDHRLPLHDRLHAGGIPCRVRF